MLGLVSRSSRGLRFCALGLATFVATTALTVDTADAKRRTRARHAVAKVTYNPPFASIIVDANSGAILQATNADLQRHPASLTKIMTLYMLFEKLEAGKIRLDSEMEVSAHAASQAPTKLGLKPGSTLQVEDAIKGLVTRSANDAAVVIAEAIGGSEEEFAKLMTRKARALGMNKTVYRNASGLPDEDQVTSARDQATLGRAIQDRFPRYYRYFATEEFRFRGRLVRGHNRLLGSVAGVDGIKTGYTRASGFNLVSSLKRDNRYIVGVVLGGRSGGSRDATMRSLLAENLPQGASRRTVAMITERNGPEIASAPVRTAQAAAPAQASVVEMSAADPDLNAEDSNAQYQFAQKPAPQRPLAAVPQLASVDPAPPAVAAAKSQPSTKPMPLSSGVISSQAAAVVSSDEPMTPVRVHTVQVRSGAKVAAAPTRIAPVAQAEPSAELERSAPAPIVTSAIAPVAETSQAGRTSVVPKTSVAVAAAPMGKTDPAPRNPAHGTGQGILGTLPAHASSAMASADPAQTIPAAAVPVASVRAIQETKVETIQHNGAIKPVVRTGWIIQVGALESEREARARLDAARDKAQSLLGKADPFTEAVAKGDKQLYRARFAGLDKDKAEAACKTLKRSDISCIAIKN